ncbi:MAG: lamin tail domain-containing protein [Candidatus Latescibacteria bacterium]|nr:lamin tail domain-containing protein [Candidatus Latescibacterota bacterium]
MKSLVVVVLMMLAASSSICAAVEGDVVINELMWMGSTVSSADEWIELRNTTDSEILLSDWTLEKAGTAGDTLTIPEGKTIPAQGFFLIANYEPSSENSGLTVKADWVTTAVSLVNTKLQIVLKDAEGNVMDTADDGVGDPAAGDNDGKRSMVRNDPPGDGTLADSWHTATEASGWKEDATEKGTPRNSLSTISVEGASWGRVKGMRIGEW